MNKYTKRYPTVLSIAGSDCSGGAGIQADIKTLSALGVYACSAITSIVAENTVGVQAIASLSPEMLRRQISSVLDDILVDALKIGMLQSSDMVTVVREAIEIYKPHNIVLDPVMVATSGDILIEEKSANYLKESLFSKVDLITPNLDEAKYLVGMDISTLEEMKEAALLLHEMGCKNVLIKGGHLPGNRKQDLLLTHDKGHYIFESATIETENTHGTGCSLSSAIAAYLAKGFQLVDAVEKAKKYIGEAILSGSTYSLGKGKGPVNHFFSPEPMGFLSIEK